MNNPQKKLDHIAIAESLKAHQDNFLLRTEIFATMAVELKARFDALKTAGFNDEQALELIKAQVIP